MGTVCYLSLGSNMGDRRGHLQEALRRISDPARVLSVSSFYETEPVEFTSQSWFLNCAVAVETEDTPKQLIERLLEIEQQMGRLRTANKGPRIIDLDVLLCGDQVLSTPALTLPHPAMARRRFVLQPLAEIAPDLRHPVLNKTIRELLSELPPGQQVHRLSQGSGSLPGPRADGED